MRISRMRIGTFGLAAFVALMALFIPANLPAWQKSIRFDRITPEDGLPEEYVMSMAQDSFGYLWFGTGSGLAKYDGHRFTVYRQEPGKPDSLSSSTVISVFVDSEGTVWAGTDVGLDRFDRATETFDPLPP